MKSNTIRILVIFGVVALIALASVQFYLLQTAYQNKQRTFEQSVQVALFQVAKRVNNNRTDQLPQYSPVIKESGNTYIVDLNKEVDCEILEFFLISEFERANIQYDYEFAVYDCYSDALIYGNYISFGTKKEIPDNAGNFSKSDELVYYFIVHFPTLKSDLFGSLKLWGLFAILFSFVLLFTVYAIWVVLSQQRYSELQKTFVSTMTHEFRTPLSASNVAIEYLQNTNAIKADEKLSKYVNLIDLQNNRFNELIERLLHMSKSEKKSMVLVNENIDLIDLIENVKEGIQHSAPHAQFKTDYWPDKVEIIADIFHSQNVLHALIDNAIKYSYPTPHIFLRCKKTDSYALLTIEDNGVGISPKYKQKVFKQFFRIPTGNIHNVKGFGIGLYYVKLLCKRMGWKINLESNKQGTKVQLKIPLRKHTGRK